MNDDLLLSDCPRSIRTSEWGGPCGHGRGKGANYTRLLFSGKDITQLPGMATTETTQQPPPTRTR